MPSSNNAKMTPRFHFHKFESAWIVIKVNEKEYYGTKLYIAN